MNRVLQTLLNLTTASCLLLALGCPATEPTDPAGSGPALDQITSEARPTKRSEVIAVADDASGQVLMFGGNEAPIVNQVPRAVYLDETWTFEPGVGWEQVDGVAPHARGRYGASMDPSGGKAYVFGGRFREEGQSGAYDLFADLWAYDFAAETWTMVDDGNGSGPSARYYPQLVWSTTENALYVYGGLTNRDPLVFQRSQELWRWTEVDGWSLIPTSGSEPSARAFYGTTYDASRNRMLLFAGQLGDFQSLAYNDLFALDLETHTWTELHPGGVSAPFTRMHPHLVYDDKRDRLLLFGGHTDVGDDNDLWQFTDGDAGWQLIRESDTFTGVGFGCLGNPTEVPADYVEQDLEAPERRQKAFFAMMHDNLWIFGGMHAECSEHLDDTWRYDLQGDTWHELIEARIGESCLRRGDDCECLCL